MNILTKSKIYARFLTQLPFDAMIMGRSVSFEGSTESGFTCTVHDIISPNRPVEVIRNWDKRKFLTYGCPELQPGYSSIVESLGNRAVISQFLRFFLLQPIGLRMFFLKSKREIYLSHKCRIDAVDEALAWWYAIKTWTAVDQCKLPIAVACAAYRGQIPKYEIDREKKHLVPGILWTCMCGTSVTHPSGFCHHHRTPETKTLFNYYPWFASEGLQELM
ncbi:MAG TPA: hypothetical protein PLR25_12860 [Planctomycetaceae bacterium]|nr:hypothetical protein [Planctomycetaceae bacterium]